MAPAAPWPRHLELRSFSLNTRKKYFARKKQASRAVTKTETDQAMQSTESSTSASSNPMEQLAGFFANYHPEMESTMKHRALLATPTDPNTFFQSHPMSKESFKTLLAAQSFQGKLHDVKDTVQAMKELDLSDPKAETLALLSAASKSKNLSTAKEVFESTMAASPMNVDRRVFAAYVSALVAGGDLEGGFLQVQRMKELGLTPSSKVYDHLLTGCIRANQLSRAWDLYREMTSSGVDPSAHTLTIMIKACAVERKAEMAVSLFDQFETLQLRPTDVTYNSIIYACAQNERMFRDALRYYDRMLGAEVEPSRHTLAALILACSRAGYVGRGLELMKTFSTLGFAADERICNTLIAMFARAQDYTKIVKDERRARDLSAIRDPMRGESDIEALKLNPITPEDREANIRNAWAIFNTMEAEKLPISAVTLNAVLKVYTAAHKAEEAEAKVFPLYSKFGLPKTGQFYRHLMRMHMELGEQQRVYDYYKEMKKNGIAPDLSTANLKLRTAMDGDNLKETLSVLREMKQLDLKPLDQLRARLLRIKQPPLVLRNALAMFGVYYS
eukprot:GILK01004084.1.p1 GENE.GILK01004084.1~~GILK01004084.1.p1  ORF type:complete len:657 (+),score=93.46 GILK01004084.1:297-1973(+)